MESKKPNLSPISQIPISSMITTSAVPHVMGKSISIVNPTVVPATITQAVSKPQMTVSIKTSVQHIPCGAAVVAGSRTPSLLANSSQ